MEAAVVAGVAGKITPKLLEFLEANRKLRHNLEHDIKRIKSEFAMIYATIEQDDARSGGGNDQVQKAWIEIIRDLAHAIEDCIDRFTHRVTMPETGKADAPSSWVRRAARRLTTVKARNEFASAIHELKNISKDASDLRTTYGITGIFSATPSETAAAEEDDDALSAGGPVGMDSPRDELLQLIQQQQQQQLKVISIVGFDGIGKTLLARHVYESAAVASEYEARAWVTAPEVGGTAAAVLKEILRQLGQQHQPMPANLRLLRASLRELLRNKRFFVVIDNMRKPFWYEIRDAFVGLRGIVVVTTPIQSVANACAAAAHGHVYAMATLADQHSRRLFFNEAFQDDDWPTNGDDTRELGSEALKKCDGLPLALVTTARFLQSNGDPTPANWARLCDDLGMHLETNEMLARTKCVLARSYTGLRGHDVRTCLLYLGIYPIDRPVRRGSLLRKWLAEGFIQGDHARSAMDAAIGNLQELVDRSIIIHPTTGSDHAAAAGSSCHTHGMMLEFILRKSHSDNFITLLRDQHMDHTTRKRKIRWLSLHHANATEVDDLSLVRSLTVFGKAHESMFDFSKYQLLRVLDLEECHDHLGDSHLKEICSKLLLLRYLSLGAAVKVTMLPEEIKKLQLLETLDVRRTGIDVMPPQVMELPCLIHLFGKFKLQPGLGGRRMRKLQAWLEQKSKLQTAAGFVVDDDRSQGFAQLMDRMKKLAKVKIWCEQSSSSSSSSNNNGNLSHLSKAIKAFIRRSTRLKEARSLSLNFSDQWFQDMLINLSIQKEEDASYYLRSLKLEGGKIPSLPPFVTMLAGLTKLCISSPHHQLSREVLAALSRVRGLEYLKLIATHLDKLVIGHGALGCLRRLCVVVEYMTDLEIQEGALPLLGSLRLLCKDLKGFSGAKIQLLPRLKEIALHDGLSDGTKLEWKEAAKKHPRHPKLLFVRTAVDVKGEEPEENSENPADTTLSATPPSPDAISNGRSVLQFVTSETVGDQKLMGSEPATAGTPMAPSTTDILPPFGITRLKNECI